MKLALNVLIYLRVILISMLQSFLGSFQYQSVYDVVDKVRYSNSKEEIMKSVQWFIITVANIWTENPGKKRCTFSSPVWRYKSRPPTSGEL